MSIRVWERRSRSAWQEAGCGRRLSPRNASSKAIHGGRVIAAIALATEPRRPRLDERPLVPFFLGVGGVDVVENRQRPTVAAEADNVFADLDVPTATEPMLQIRCLFDPESAAHVLRVLIELKRGR